MGINIKNSNFKGTKGFPPVALRNSTILPAEGAVDPLFNEVTMLLPLDGNLTDESNESHSLSVATGSTSFVSGKFNQAVDYDGATRVTAPFATSLSFDADFTLEFWLNTDDNSGTNPGAMVSCWDPFNGNRGFLFAHHPNAPGKLVFYLGDGTNNIPLNATNSSFGSPLSTASNITENVWHHIAAVRTGVNILLFVDGSQEASASGVSATINNNGADFFSGGHISGGGSPNFFDGRIDDVRLTKGTARYTSSFTPPTSAFPTN